MCIKFRKIEKFYLFHCTSMGSLTHFNMTTIRVRDLKLRTKFNLETGQLALSNSVTIISILNCLRICRLAPHIITNRKKILKRKNKDNKVSTLC